MDIRNVDILASGRSYDEVYMADRVYKAGGSFWTYHDWLEAYAYQYGPPSEEIKDYIHDRLEAAVALHDSRQGSYSLEKFPRRELTRAERIYFERILPKWLEQYFGDVEIEFFNTNDRKSWSGPDQPVILTGPRKLAIDPHSCPGYPVWLYRRPDLRGQLDEFPLLTHSNLGMSHRVVTLGREYDPKSKCAILKVNQAVYSECSDKRAPLRDFRQSMHLYIPAYRGEFLKSIEDRIL